MGTCLSVSKRPQTVLKGCINKPVANVQRKLSKCVWASMVDVQAVDRPRLVGDVMVGRVILYEMKGDVRAITFQESEGTVLVFK